MLEFGVVSHLSAAVVYGLLAGFTASRYLRRYTDRAVLLASLLTTLWALIVVAQNLWGWPSFTVRYLTELTRNAAWILVLFALVRDAREGAMISRRMVFFTAGTFIMILSLLAVAAVVGHIGSRNLLSARASLFGQLAISLLGISVLEQIWRNASTYGRSSIRYICFGVGGIFIFEFILYADALLFDRMSKGLWDARGAVNVLLVPLFAVNLINARRQPVQLQLSRAFVFHAGTFVLGGIYLLVVAAAGYYVRLAGGEWGEGLQVVFIASFVLLFVLLMTSDRFRARLMMFVSQNFFDYKYDYRDEWLKMTETFSNLNENPPLPERAIRTLAGLVESHTGGLWLRDEDGHYSLHATLGLEAPKHTQIDSDTELVRFFREREWILDLHEYRDDPVRYNLLEIPDAILGFRDQWLIIPLYLGRELYGIALIGSPYTRVELNWENFDLIRVVGRQLSNFLAQADAQDRLSRAMQFEAVNKASAFMVHDLKTLIAQLSLLVRNAPKHRNNPEFIDDMIQTTDHAVNKMSRLVDHIRKPESDDRETSLDLAQLCQQLVDHHGRQEPVPGYNGPTSGIEVQADPQQLQNVLSHLLQNAQDATPKEGEVSLTLKASEEYGVLFIQDTGQGMSEHFIRDSLFKPFESTKGLTGMGIGAYQAQEYVKQIGGTMDVTSEPGVGSCFTIRLPLLARHSETPG
ncbi:signal transduction histidine kinase [Halospina denitrificans]|uniref:histidine kinase n=1 Tax=Halospina denitrificans TaxID=332522 RepID=A0A4R7JVG5_9GAMM|nr:XrtA/PEP-CTERM system histidine kinase PrsK [Halospina denitrificans]TDT41413.1 signal transduction histidine kinase [Halospina denitrificans]